MTLQTYLNSLTFKLESKEKLIRGRTGYYAKYTCDDVIVNVYVDKPKELEEILVVGNFELECIGINDKQKRFYSAGSNHDLTVNMDGGLEEETITLADLKDKKYEVCINYFKKSVDNEEEDY